MRVDFRAIFDFFSGETDREMFAVRIGLTENVWRYEHVLSGKPRACIHDNMLNSPILFIKIERAQSPNIAVRGVNRIAL